MFFTFGSTIFTMWNYFPPLTNISKEIGKTILAANVVHATKHSLSENLHWSSLTVPFELVYVFTVIWCQCSIIVSYSFPSPTIKRTSIFCSYCLTMLRVIGCSKLNSLTSIIMRSLNLNLNCWEHVVARQTCIMFFLF